MTTKEYRDRIMEELSAVGDFSVRPMMGEYCLYCGGVLVGDLCDNRFLVKRTPTSDRLLVGLPLQLPYEGSKQQMYVLDETDPTVLQELFSGMVADLSHANTNLSKCRKKK